MDGINPHYIRLDDKCERKILSTVRKQELQRLNIFNLSFNNDMPPKLIQLKVETLYL